MSTAIVERVAAPAAGWSEWKTGDDGLGERRFFVYRERLDRQGPLEHHLSARGTLTKYTMAGAEKKAHELNREVADGKRRDMFLAKVAADRKAQEDMAREVREVAQCGTANSEAIARWIIGNFTWTDEVEELREIANEAQASAESERDNAKDAEERLEKVQERCNSLATEARILLAEFGAFGPPVFADPLEFATGNTPLEKVVDMSRNLLTALAAYEMES